MNGYKELEKELNWIYDFMINAAFLKTEEIEEQQLSNNIKNAYRSIIETKKVFELEYISQNRESFEENLLYWSGLTKEDIIKNIIFELYANEIYKSAKLNKNEYLTETQFLKEYIAPKVKKECIEIENEEEMSSKIKERIKDKKRYNAKYYWDKYSNVCSDELLNKDTTPFWQKVTHYSNLFGDIDDINNKSTALSEDKNYTFPNFQIPLYSFIACNYTEKSTLLTYFLNGDFNKANLKNKILSSSYINIIKELVNICTEQEKYKNISYYMIEKEFNPITIEMLINIFLHYSLKKVPKKTISNVIYRLYFISTINPMAFSNNKIFEVIANSHIGKEDESRGLPCNIEIKNIRFINEFYNILLSIANNMFKGKMKDLIKDDEESFLSIYEKEGDSMLASIKKLTEYIDELSDIKDSFKSIMELKKEINTDISKVNKKVKEMNNIKKHKNTNDINQCIYLKEDINDLVNHNELLRLLFRIPKTI